MKIHDFRKFKYTDPYELDPYANKSIGGGQHWSRVYEYPAALTALKKYSKDTNVLIHNTSWGWEGVHIMFKNQLEERYHNTINSDIKHSALPNTFIYDITNEPSDEYKNKYDFVLNISVIEELPIAEHINTIKKLFSQVKTGGFFIMTFDIDTRQSLSSRGINLKALEEYLNTTIRDFGDINLICDNSAANINHPIVNGLECGILILQQ
jgi:hypothetical protein